MKEILLGMTIGGILGVMLYKNSASAKQLFDSGEKIVTDEITKINKASNKKHS